ncbi:hypothetical protein ACGFWD_39170 [Streptomyces sp. NPDC048448]|uniref:hypothetical protein n=1 Tax=unclassified Streptomyces TaxID=2593676 RepID=UPI00143E3EA0|nr:hypothetical protein [Streptomyces sp. RPA4-2]QIY60371.1 hypothetical protein HEP85_15175 [Streptomyces sp. RPA4-2]
MRQWPFTFGIRSSGAAHTASLSQALPPFRANHQYPLECDLAFKGHVTNLPAVPVSSPHGENRSRGIEIDQDWSALREVIGTMTVTMDFEKFGAAADVKAPPATRQ